MTPLNGKCAMTREERNARLKELNENPFHRALTNRTKRRWREAHKTELNERRRKNYAENREKERARQKKWRAEHPEAVKAREKRYRAKHRVANLIRNRLRNADPAYKQLKKEQRRELMKNPERRKHINALRRKYYHKDKYSQHGIERKMKNKLIPRWEILITEPEERIGKYRRRCTVQTWSLFVKWARNRGLYFDPQK